MLSGIYTPTEGLITFWDKKGKPRNINKMNPAELNKIGVAMPFHH